MPDINQNISLAEQEYWDQGYEKYQFLNVSPNDPIRQWINKYIEPASDKSCFEFGCFPGRYLSVFGELGYEINGIDLTPRVVDDLPAWFGKNNYKTGKFEQQNVFEFKSEKKFDIVCSFGLIEHFKNWEDLVKMHADLVSENGTVVIECPNFRGLFQYLIHRMFDNENLKRHYLPAMNPDKWRDIFKQLGFEIIFCGYLGDFDYWTDKPATTFAGRKTFSVLNRIKSRMAGRESSNGLWSPYIGIIAKKSGL